jgi:hypothetical protein
MARIEKAVDGDVFLRMSFKTEEAMRWDSQGLPRRNT